MSQILTISNDLRTIDIPRDFVLGVESDDDVNRVYFSMPAAYGDTNLWPYKIRINYMNANGEGDMYTVPDEDKEILSDGMVDTISIPGAVEEIRKVTDARYSSSYTQDTCHLYYNRPEEIDISGPSIWFDIDSDTIYTYRSGFGDQEWHNIEEKYVYDTTTGEWVGYPSANASQLKTILRLLARNWTINENAMISYSEDMFLFVAKTEAAANSFLAQTGSAPYFLFAEYSKNNTLVTKLYQYVPKVDGTAREWIEITDESTFGVPKNESGVPIYGDNYHIRFSWLVGRHACEIKGKVRFIVCLKLTDDQGVITNEFNTAVHEVPVLEGLETSEAIVQEREDIIEAILLRMDKIESIDIEGGYDKVIEVLDSIPEDYSELSQDVSDLKDDLSDINSHIEKTNLIEGYLDGAVNESTIVASNNYLTVFFPVESGKAYTIDKKYATQYTRLGFTTELPVIGSAISNYENLGGGTIYKTFTAPQNGYACLYIWANGDSSGATKEQVLADAVAYEGQYNSDFVSEVNAIGFDNIEKIESDLAGYFPQTILKLSHFRVGSLYVTQGSLTQSSSNYRISNYKLYPLQMVVGDVIGLTDYSHYRYLLFYSADNSSWTQGSWTIEATTITASGYYAIVVEDTNQTAQADASTMFNLIHYTDTSWVNRIDARLTYLEESKASAKFAHLSFDDVQYCMMDLKNNADTYNSIFENPFFNMLKDLHDVYGTVVSLYLFINSGDGIATWPTKFASEFADNSDWLKFGLHQGASNYASTSAATALSDYNIFTNNIINIGGTVDIIDRCPRLGNFAGNLDSLLAMRDAQGGIVGLLSAYDARDSYYLDSTDSAYLFDHGKMVDAENHLTFFRTIKTFEVANPSTELPKLLTLAGLNGSPYGIIMMHEYGIYDSSYTLVASMKERLEYACAWMVGHGYAWDFPMNRII